MLATLIDVYESEHFPMDPPDPIEAIKFRMEQLGLTRGPGGLIGTRTRVAEVLNRRRSLSIDMIRRLHERLGISAEVLIRPTRETSGLMLGYSLRICLMRAIASSTACSGLMPSAATRWTASAQTCSRWTTRSCRQSPDAAA